MTSYQGIPVAHLTVLLQRLFDFVPSADVRAQPACVVVLLAAVLAAESAESIY